MQVKWVLSVLVGAALLSACADGSSTGSSTTAVNLNSTSFATLATTPSTLAAVTTVPAAGQTSTVAQDYTIQPGDTSRVKVAGLYGITVAQLDEANLATAGYSSFYPGLKIVIPAGAKVPSLVPTTTTTPVAAVTPTSTANASTTTTAPANANGCTTGSYTIVSGDLPGRVAAKFNLTVAQLDAANASTKGYKNFIVGVKIVIPCA